MRRKRLTRRLVLGAGAASISTPALARWPWGPSGAGPVPSGGTTLTVANNGVTRPLGAISSGSGAPTDYNYPAASFTATVTNSTGVNDNLRIWNGSSFVTSAWYLNNSSSPPGSVIANATVQVPSVQAFPTWNPSGSNPPTPPITSFSLQLISGGVPILSRSVTVDVLKRPSGNVFPSLGEVGFDELITTINPQFESGAWIIGGGTNCPIVAGTITVQCVIGQPNGSFFPPSNTCKVQYTINDFPVGSIVVGPGAAGFAAFFMNFDTTTITNGTWGGPQNGDGTYALGCILVDCTSGSAATTSLPYYWRTIQTPFIIHNSGSTLATIYAGALLMPTLDRAAVQSTERPNTAKADFVTFPGFTSLTSTVGSHNTVVPIPSPQSGVIPPASSVSSPMHGLTPTQQRDPSRFFTTGIGGANPSEYLFTVRFFTTKDGGAYVSGYNAEFGQDMESNYLDVIKNCNFDGGRNDNQTDQISSAIDGHDGTYWAVFEEFGRIIKVTHDGTVVTIAGGTTNRSKLGFANNDGNIGESQLNTVLTQVGSIVSPTFGDLRGINDGCWDLTDATAGNSLLIANPIDHYIAKITGLATVATCSSGSISGTTFTVGGATTGSFAVGQLLIGPGVASGQTIQSGVSSPFTVAIAQTVTNQPIYAIGPITMFRIAGQDGGLAGAQVNPSDNGGYVDGPCTEFSAGSSVATFTGTVTGSVLTVNSGFSGTLSPGCPLSWGGGGTQNTTTGNMVLSNISGSGNGSTWNVNFASSGGAQAMTASQPVALMAGPYGVKMADGVLGPDPLGTLYIPDYQNSAIRKVAFSGGKWTTMSTLFGNQTGALRFTPGAGGFAANIIGAIKTVSTVAFQITAASWSNASGGQLTITTSSPVVQPGVDSNYGTVAPNYTITLGGLTNIGSGGASAVNGNFQVVSVGGGGTSIVVAMPAGAGVIQASPGVSFTFTGSISGNTLSVASIAPNLIAIGTIISGAGITTCYVVGPIGQVTGGNGSTWTVSGSPQTVPSGTITASAGVALWADDVYLPPSATPRALNHGAAHEAYCPMPQRVLINSTGKLIVTHTWFDAVSTVDLAASTIVYTGQYGASVANTRLNPSGQRARPDLNFSTSWFQVDVDSGVTGDVSSTGCIGPKDDIIFLDSNGNIEGAYWRCAADGSAAGTFGSNDAVRQWPLPVGRQGGGHYEWMITISRHQGRMLTSGIADTGIADWRIINPAVDFYPDPVSNQFCDGGALTRGYVSALQGTCATVGQSSAINGVFPWGLRPGVTQLHGMIGRGNLGLPVPSGVTTGKGGDTFDGLVNSFPTSAALGEFIKNGFGGALPAPEFSIGGDDLNDIIYAVQRMSLQGSIPNPISSLVQRAPYASDVTAPIITMGLISRSGTQITVNWTTDKATWGIVAAGFASGHLQPGSTTPYHLFAREAFTSGTGNPSYGTSHSVTIQTFQDVITYLVVVVKDVAGNSAISAEQTVAA